MGELYTPDVRPAAAGENFLSRSDLVAQSAETYFNTSWILDDGSVTARIVSKNNIGLYDPAKQKIIVDDEIFLSRYEYIVVFGESASETAGDSVLDIDFFDAQGNKKWGVRTIFDVFQLDILADYDRDGNLDRTMPDSLNWEWGETGSGAILLVNSDRDGAYPSREFRDRLDRTINGPLDLEDMTRIAVRLTGPDDRELSGCTLRVHVSDAAASRVRAFDISRSPPEAVIGPGMTTAVLPATRGVSHLALEGLDYPDAGFTGLITMSADVERRGELLGGTEIVLRVAPWMALPNTQPVSRLFMAEMQDNSNRDAINDMERFAKAAGVVLELVPPKINRTDRWMQDEIEIGYAQTPHKHIPVVLDSPRNRELDAFPEAMLLGPDFGYVTRGNDRQASSLDSFGNLDCAPPHTGPAGHFPFGRILFGGAAPGAVQGRRMMKVVRDFVYAQEVQHPIELYSDWLNVGHIDEFLSFVPAPDRMGFRLVLASPPIGDLNAPRRCEQGRRKSLADGEKIEEDPSAKRPLQRVAPRLQQYLPIEYRLEQKHARA